MTPGSVQLRKYITARRAGASTEDAAVIASIPFGEAALWDADEARGELDWVQPWVEPAVANIGHNSGGMEMVVNVAADELRLLIERIERLEEEKKGLADDIKDVYLEAKSRGFDAKAMRVIVRERGMEKTVREEREAILDVYRSALGLLADTPLGQAALRAA